MFDSQAETDAFLERQRAQSAHKQTYMALHARQLDERTWHVARNDGMRYVSLWRMRDPKQGAIVTLRADIQVEFYIEQSYARVERHDGAQWQLLDYLPLKTIPALTQMQCVSTSRHQGVFTPDELGTLRAVASELLLSGCQILGLLDPDYPVGFDFEEGHADL